jgi:hypothetical protein
MRDRNSLINKLKLEKSINIDIQAHMALTLFPTRNTSEKLSTYSVIMAGYMELLMMTLIVTIFSSITWKRKTPM